MKTISKKCACGKMAASECNCGKVKKYSKGGVLLTRKDGSKSLRGLWDNIRAKKRRGAKMRKKGDEGAPTQEAIRKSQE